MYIFTVFLLSVLTTVNGEPESWPQIIGGHVAQATQFPHQVSLQNMFGHHFCGGAIIHRKFILTAAHCVCPNNFNYIQVGVGITKLIGFHTKYPTKTLYCHNNYVPGQFDNDIALIELSNNLEYNERVQPIEIYTMDLPRGSRLIVSGWGYERKNGVVAKELKYAMVHVMDREVCKRMAPTWHITSKHLCVVPADDRSCNGDSGGPAVLEYENGFLLAGLVSFGGPGCPKEKPTIFVRVASYIPWIHTIVKHNNFAKLRMAGPMNRPRYKMSPIFELI